MAFLVESATCCIMINPAARLKTKRNAYIPRQKDNIRIDLRICSAPGLNIFGQNKALYVSLLNSLRDEKWQQWAHATQNKQS